MIKSTYEQFFKAMCNQTRLGIILSLKSGPKSVGEIVSTLGIEQSRVSHNLRCLAARGFVSVKQNGKHRIYSLNKETILPILIAVKKHIKKHDNVSC